MSFKTPLAVIFVLLIFPFTTSIAQSEYLNKNESGYGLMLATTQADQDAIGLVLGTSLGRKVDLAIGFSTIVTNDGGGFYFSLGSAFYPLEYLEQEFPVSLGITFGFSRYLSKGGRSIHYFGIKGYKQFILGPIVTLVPVVDIEKNYIQDGGSLTTVAYGFSLGFNTKRADRIVRGNRTTIALEAATSKVENQRAYFIGVGFIVKK